MGAVFSSKESEVPGNNKHGISNELVEIYRDAFNAFDSNGGGSMGITEVEGLLNAFGVVNTSGWSRNCFTHIDCQRPTADELELMVLEVDEDGSGESEVL